MGRLLWITLLLGLLQTASGQVVNTEKIRFANQQKAWEGDFRGQFGLRQTKAGRTLSLGLNGRTAFQFHPKHQLMLLGGYQLTQFLDVDDPGAVPKNFSNAEFTHLRYNFNWVRSLLWKVLHNSSGMKFTKLMSVYYTVLVGDSQ